MSNTKTETLCFSITGEFVTNIARDWLYAEKRPYKKVIDFLLSCMCGSDFDKKTLLKYAHDILTGKKKITGSTADNSYCMIEDDTDILSLYPNYFENKPVEYEPIEYVDDEENPIVDTIKIRCRRGKRARQKVKQEEKQFKNNYGWLNPDGEFFESEWGSHQAWAHEYIRKTCGEIKTSAIFYSCDFLEKKGWVLLHNPSQQEGIANLDYIDIPSLTEKQKDFLYEYYAERGMPKTAREIYSHKNEGNIL